LPTLFKDKVVEGTDGEYFGMPVMNSHAPGMRHLGRWEAFHTSPMVRDLIQTVTLGIK
jgi:hypothetical protein